MIINKDKVYKEDEFIHFMRKYTGETRKIKGKNNSKRTYKEFDMVEISFNDIVDMNLNGKGVSVPYSNENVINISRYMFYYWLPIIGSDAINLFILLNEYCDKDTDICYPKVGELADRLGRSKPTLNKALDKLEENNFVVVINRLNKVADNRETSPIYKIRKTVPLLSIDQYKKLPPILKEKHDEFMKKYGGSTKMDYFNYDADETMEELISNGDKIVSKKSREKINQILEEEKEAEYILASLSETEKLYRETFHNAIQMRRLWSKPSFENFFGNSICILDEETNIISLILNEVGKLYLEGNYNAYRRLADLFDEIYETEIAGIDYYTFTEYIEKNEKA